MRGLVRKRAGGACTLGVLSGMLLVTGLARADDIQEGAMQLIRADASTREPLRIAPKLHENGRVGDMRVGDPELHVTGAEPLPITGADMVVQTIAPRERTTQVGKVDAEALRSEVARLFDGLRMCRMEAARAERIAPAQVIAGELDLHWTIRVDGSAADLSVSSRAPTDPRVIECVRRRVLGTQFTRPTGGAVPVDYRFAFAR